MLASGSTSNARPGSTIQDQGFEPLLPPADTALEHRADALVDWCRGFLGGLGLAGVSREHGLSADGAEILSDFGTIAGTRFEYADGEEDESALTEVIEFIRVGVLLLHAEIVSAPQARRDPALTWSREWGTRDSGMQNYR